MADGRPDDLDDAYFAARNATEAEAAAWKARFEADPQDLLARASWIGWHMGRNPHEFLDSPEFGAQILWLVRNQPGSSLTSLIAPLKGGHPRGSLESELNRAWSAALDQHPEDVRVLKNAASYFALEDRDKSHELLLAIRDRCKEDPGAESALAIHWLLRAQRFQSRFDAGPYSFEKEFDATHGRRALEHAERAIELKGPGSFSEWFEVTRIEAAAAAGAWDRATEVARAALARTADGAVGKVTGNLAFHANRILGHAALRREDLAAARQHLLACCSGGTSPQLGSFGPDWSLSRELLERGERDVVLEFLQQCRTIWPGHDDDLDLWVLQIQRGEVCAFGRAGMSVPRRTRAPNADRETASIEEEPDDRDPTERAYVAGLRGSEEQAHEWLSQIQRDPKDLCARASWLGWAGRVRKVAQLDEVRKQLEWIVQNAPAHPFAGHAAVRFTHFGQRALKEFIDELWTRHIQRQDVAPEVLGNAAEHFGDEDRLLALELLGRAAQLDPTNPKWPAQSAFVRLGAAQRRTSSIRFAESYDASRCEDAWIDAERAYQLSDRANPDYLLLETLMKAAAGAGRWKRASEVAGEALERIPIARVLRVRREHCLKTAHVVLGLAALARGDRDEARSELRASVACLSIAAAGFNHPNALLAMELLSLGDREALIEFLESARRLCPDEQTQIDLWQQQARTGRTPKLDFSWLYL